MAVEYLVRASEACRAHRGNHSIAIVAILRFDCQEHGDRACVFFDEQKDRRPTHVIRDRDGRLIAKRIAFSRRSRLTYWMFSVHAPFDAKKTLVEKHRSRVDPSDPQCTPTYAAMVESMDANGGLVHEWTFAAST